MEENQTPKNTDLKKGIINFKNWFVGLLDIRHDSHLDVKGTIEGIKDGIDFKGLNVWILICSIFMASIGLNINAVGVIIGAMLIAPLMGPILGMGLAVGTNDYETLKRSLKAFGIMTGIGLFCSWLYFVISPISAETSELLGRVAPTFLDGLVALFGGIAGIVAGSRKLKSNVIPGVAIATALMPPLCTAGYGLAIGNFGYFLGAGYLFLLNSVLIALATYMGVKYLRFPLVKYVDYMREAKIKKMIALFTFIVLIPSGFILYNVTTESLFNTKAEGFITEVVKHDGTEVINYKLMYDSDNPKIEIFTIGERVPESVIATWKNQLSFYVDNNTSLEVFQSKDDNIDLAGQLLNEAKEGIVADLYEKQAEVLKNKDERIKFLEDEIIAYKKKEKDEEIPVKQISQELFLNFPVANYTFSPRAIEATGNLEIDTLPVIWVDWKGRPEPSKLQKWLQIRLELDTVRIINQ
jgi:uncharacterized hydrophobic protein (TIGR00271 family)